MYIVVIILGTSVGATTSADSFLNISTIKIVVLGLVALAVGTAAGVIFGKIMCVVLMARLTHLLVQLVYLPYQWQLEYHLRVGARSRSKQNFLLMHAMVPNVAGVIGTAVAAGTFMAIFGIVLK